MQDEYLTIAGIAESRLVVKKSRFLGLATAIRSQHDFRDFMTHAQETYPAASHYCYAYTLGLGASAEERASDAGEPTHSAGPPILSAVQACGLTNIACIVVRYFGGTKLGVGGLIRAYGRCARECLEQATIQKQILTEPLTVRTPYATLGSVIQWVERANGSITDAHYDQEVEVELELRLSLIDDFIGEMQGLHPSIEVEHSPEV